MPPGAAAITIGPVISLRRHLADAPRLVAHELVHVGQWRDLGVIGFMTTYLGAYLRWRLLGHGHWAAYRRIPLEIEAGWCSRLSQFS